MGWMIVPMRHSRRRQYILLRLDRNWIPILVLILVPILVLIPTASAHYGGQHESNARQYHVVELETGICAKVSSFRSQFILNASQFSSSMMPSTTVNITLGWKGHYQAKFKRGFKQPSGLPRSSAASMFCIMMNSVSSAHVWWTSRQAVNRFHRVS